MQPDIDTGTIRRKVHLTYFQDGLWDLFLGLFLLAWGITVWSDLPWLPGIVFAGFFWLALGLKQKITYPRIGFARTVEHRSRLLKIAIAGAVVLLAAVVLLPLISSGRAELLRDYFEFLFGSAIAVAIALVGYYWSVIRWYAYAALVFVSAAVNQWLWLTFPLSFIIPAAIVLLCGAIVLSRFLSRYHVVSEEDTRGI